MLQAMLHHDIHIDHGSSKHSYNACLSLSAFVRSCKSTVIIKTTCPRGPAEDSESGREGEREKDELQHILLAVDILI